MRLRRRISVGGVAGLLVSCQALLSSDVVQCNADSDCAARGAAFAGTRCESHVCRATSSADAGPEGGDGAPADPKWGCLGKITWASQSPTEKVRVLQRFHRLVGGTPIVGLHIKACASLDPECVTPLTEADTNASGDAILEVPRNFRGYFHMPVGPSSFPNMAPSLVALYPPPDKDVLKPPAEGAVPILVSIAELDTLLLQVKSAADPSLGHVFGFAVTCDGAPAAGVSLRTSIKDSKTVQYYYEGNGTPSVTAQESDATGNAGFLNLPTGVVSLETQVPSLARRAGSYSVLVKKGTVTVIDLVPTP